MTSNMDGVEPLLPALHVAGFKNVKRILKREIQFKTDVLKVLNNISPDKVYHLYFKGYEFLLKFRSYENSMMVLTFNIVASTYIEAEDLMNFSDQQNDDCYILHSLREVPIAELPLYVSWRNVFPIFKELMEEN